MKKCAVRWLQRCLSPGEVQLVGKPKKHKLQEVSARTRSNRKLPWPSSQCPRSWRWTPATVAVASGAPRYEIAKPPEVAGAPSCSESTAEEVDLSDECRLPFWKKRRNPRRLGKRFSAGEAVTAAPTKRIAAAFLEQQCREESTPPAPRNNTVSCLNSSPCCPSEWKEEEATARPRNSSEGPREQRAA